MSDKHRAERAIKAEAANRKLKKRASSGTCPCCSRTFANMATHMKCQHPDYVRDNGGEGRCRMTPPDVAPTQSLKPCGCPFCGLEMQEVTDEDGHYWVHPGRRGVERADCWLADAWISDEATGEGSIGEWNTRASQSPSPAPGVKEMVANSEIDLGTCLRNLRGLASRMQYRVEAIEARDGTRADAITGKGVGIGYLLAKDLADGLTEAADMLERLATQGGGELDDDAIGRARQVLEDHFWRDDYDGSEEGQRLYFDTATRLAMRAAHPSQRQGSEG